MLPDLQDNAVKLRTAEGSGPYPFALTFSRLLTSVADRSDGAQGGGWGPLRTAGQCRRPACSLRPGEGPGKVGVGRMQCEVWASARSRSGAVQ